MADREPKYWITVNGKHVPIYDGESKQDAYNRAIKSEEEKAKSSEKGRMINGKFYTEKELKNMTLDQMREMMGGSLGSDKFKSDSNKDVTKYSFSSEKSLSDIEKDWLEQAVDWANGDDNIPMIGMNTIANYYGVKFGKSASVIKEIKDNGDIVFSSMNKALINQAMDNVEKLKNAIKQKEKLK